MSELTPGPVTFLFTDIERSTQSAALVGDERYAEVLQDHRSLLRDVCGGYGGREFATEGDALFFAFVRPTEAVAAALAAQHAVEKHEWPADFPIRVRMGLHTGEAVVSHGEYVGHNVHKAKRICDAGHGGQILVSEATAALMASLLPADLMLVDLGPHRLKDLGQAERIYQLTATDLQADFPPLRSLESFNHNLPLQRSSFIGRSQEISEILKLLDDHRLVTLAGVGGVGKTRLSLQVGAEVLDRFPDGVFFVALAPLSDPELLPRAVGDAVGMIIGGGITGGTPVPVTDLVIEHLTRRHCLVIFDNCEHLINGCGALIDRILARCPDVTVLATTRETLGVDGEQVWRVPSMTVAADRSEVEQSEAIRLFVARAQAVQPMFDLTDSNVDAVREICARLDGIPLAIELAASRVTHLSPQQIAERLNDMFRLLTGARRRVQRQQTLEASLDWSHELLSEDERTLLRRLAVFSGSFSLDAAEEVFALNNGTVVLDVLRSLVDKSLVISELHAAEARYRMLAPVRAYAAEHLVKAGEAERFRERHRDYYLSWLESFPADEATFGFRAFTAFDREHDNLRAAIEWSAAQGRYDFVALMANRLLTLWWNGGYSDEGHRWLSAAVDSGAVTGEELAAAYTGLTACAVLRVDGRARQFAEKAVEAAAGLPSHRSIAFALGSISSGVIAELTRDDVMAAESREWMGKAVRTGAEAGPAWNAFALVIAGQVELILRDVEAADRYLQESLRMWSVPSISVVGCASALTVTRHILGDADGALAAARTAAAAEEQSWQPGLGANSLGLALAGVGQHDDANAALAGSLRNAKSWGISLWLNEALVFCGAVAAVRGDPGRASRLLSAGRYLGDAPNMPTPFRTAHSYALYLHYLPRVRRSLHRDIARQTRLEGRAMSMEEATTYALEGLA